MSDFPNKVVQWSQLRSTFFMVSLRFFTIKMLHYTGPLTTTLGDRMKGKRYAAYC